MKPMVIGLSAAFSAAPFDPAQVVSAPVGSGKLSFTDESNGSFAYTVNGVSQTKAITRQVLFSDPELQSELRYFEVAPGGFSTLERHEHTHNVLILRGSGHCLVGREVRKLATNDLVAVPPMSRVPGCPRWLAGVVNWRGRVLPVVDPRTLLGAEPTLQLLRPVPVTAWLPLSMIFFGLGPNAAIFLVFLGAFYPILLNTTFGVRSVDVRLFEAAAMLGAYLELSDATGGAVNPLVKFF